MPEVFDELANAKQAVEEEATTKVEIFKNLHELSDKQKSATLQELQQRLRVSKDFMGRLYPQMISAYKKYRSIAEPLRDELGNVVEGRANIFIPYPFGIVESAIPRLAGKLPRIHVFPYRDEEKEKVRQIENNLLYTFDRMQYLRMQPLWMRQFEIYGWSPLFYFWQYEEKVVLERIKKKDGGFGIQKVKKVTRDDFAAHVLDVFDCFIQPGVEIIEEGDWFMFREWVSAKDILRWVDNGIFYPEAKKYVEDVQDGSNGSDLLEAGRTDRDSFAGLEKNFEEHSYGKFEVMYCLEDTRTLAMINRQVLARVGDNPNPLQEKPLINLNLLPVIGEPIGISTIEALAGLPDKLNLLSSARLDAITLSLNQVAIANRYAVADFQNVQMTAGNIILVDDIDASIKFLDPPNVGNETEREIITTKDEMQFSASMSDFLSGGAGATRQADTATGVTTIVRESNAKNSLKLAAFEAYPLRKLVQVAHQYNMTYMDEEKRISLLGPEGYVSATVTIDDILCECDFIIEPGSSVPLDQQSRREALLQLTDRVLQMPQVVDVRKFIKELLEAHDIRNPDSFLVEQPQELDQYNDVRLAEAENIALGRGEPIALKGNDDLHLPIHQTLVQSREWEEMSEDFKQQTLAHIEAHSQRKQSLAAAAQAAGQNQLFGGQQNGPETQTDPSQPGAGGEASIFGGQPSVGGAPGVPSGGTGFISQ